MRMLKASYWEYIGTHPDGKNYEGEDLHEFGLKLIDFVAYCGEFGGYLECKDIELIRVTQKTKTDSARELVVSAPKEVWDKAKKFMIDNDK